MEKIVHVAGHLACRRYKQFIRSVDVEILVVDDFILSVYIDQEIEYRTEFQACIRIYRCKKKKKKFLSLSLISVRPSG